MVFKLEPKSQYHQINYQKVLHMFNNIFQVNLLFRFTETSLDFFGDRLPKKIRSNFFFAVASHHFLLCPEAAIAPEKS